MTVVKRRLVLAFILSGAAMPGRRTASAQPAAPASGNGATDDKRVVLDHAVAVGLDNAEGLLEPHIRMRVVLSDRVVPADALFGIAFPPVRDMAKRGEVSGLLFEFDPNDKTSAQVTNLARLADPAEFLRTLSISDSNGLWRKLDVTATHISGHFVSDDNGLDMVFDTPVITDPVVSNLTGAAVASSPFVKMLRAHTLALSKGDLAALNALSSQATQVHDAKQLPPIGNPQFKASVAAYAKSLDKASRVVVRGRTAVVVLPDDAFAQFVKEGGDWKIAD